MKQRLFLTAISVLPALASGAKRWPADLDWAPLQARLSDDASLIDTSFADWESDCLPEFNKPQIERTNHALIDQPSGMCVAHLVCAYEQCYPRPNSDGHAETTQLQRTIDMSIPEASFGDLSSKMQDWLEDPVNPALNLPSKVLFPAVASDVVAAVDFARGNGLEISVKNSGHSYMGASTKRDTLHVNMNRFKRYAPTGIVECGSDDDDDAVCALALARGKPGYIRVGGGENWDKTYRAVADFNQLGGNKYHVLGGAAGTVSPMGWTFQGGLSGTTGGTMYGLGADQILHVEMVLPNGLHVKFGPAEWEGPTANGFVAPKTTSVAGLCRSNPNEVDEDAWEWGACPEDILGVDFDDLWYAVSGGGGGTWGVVTSIYLQLHEYLMSSFYTPMEMSPTKGPICDKILFNPSPYQQFFQIWERFRAMWLFTPSDLNITKAGSDACGAPLGGPGTSSFFCFGEGSHRNMVNTWESFLTTNQDQLPSGVTVDDVLACATNLPGTSHLDRSTIHKGPFAGKIRDGPLPGILEGTAPINILNVLIPRKFLESNKGITIFGQYTTWEMLAAGSPPYYAFGSASKAASDQANSLSDAHRGAGAAFFIPQDLFYGKLFHILYDTTDKSNFPSFQGSNHAASWMMGPLKDDWSKACPLEWTMREREEKCISIQETIYGTKTLKRLEAIKEALDPDYMFDCNGCIGNNRMKDAPDAPSPIAEATNLGPPVLRGELVAS